MIGSRARIYADQTFKKSKSKLEDVICRLSKHNAYNACGWKPAGGASCIVVGSR